MEITFSSAAMQDVATDALVIGVVSRQKEQQSPLFSRAARAVDDALDGLLQDLFSSGEFKGEAGDLITVHTMGKLATRRVVLVGLGKQEKLQPLTIQRAYGAAARHLQQTGAHTVALSCLLEDAPLDLEAQTRAAIEGALLSIYTFKKYRQADTHGNGRGMSRIEVLAGASLHARLEPAMQRAIAFAEATNFVRDLVNEPPNVLTPGELANRASLVAKQFHLDFEALERPQIQDLGMGGLLAVSQGSAEPAKFIIMRYHGAPARSEKDVVLVGKGVTFDTGGILIKPAENMYKMKGDMAGAAAVIGAMYAIAALQPAINVTALVPTTENMPGGTAFRPGDILRIMNGKTIEIINTDAEGRLILADALSYAVLKEQATTIIDVATLTGGITIALGSVMSGLFCNDDELSAQIVAAGQQVGEKFWRMPLDDEYAEAIASDVADIKQTGGRPASSVIAAKILEHFVGSTHWAHLDIAGTDFSDVRRPYAEKGATGFAARTLAELVLKRAGSI
jgi:leucyl aminopeptidase